MGVKSLWDLLAPVGRPVMLETMEGKAMAIDSSIWIYQFQATMRDKEGRGLINAHVLGFLRRICKLLFYGIRPVFVFDGGAPALKRSTLAERKKKKAGAAASHIKVAERLLAAQMRREAVVLAQSTSSDPKGKGKVPQGSATIDEETVYLEDVDSAAPKTPAKKVPPTSKPRSPPSSSKKARWHDHDPYLLPGLDFQAAVAEATKPSAPDPRLATEEELRAYIDEFRSSELANDPDSENALMNIDITSAAFRALPTEVQYEILGDMRLRSRQTSHARLQTIMRRTRGNALAFSAAQIRGLRERNALTQRVLATTDSIGRANVTIPVRIAAERNREYVLVKNDADAGGGWILGRRDEGTIHKPIQVDEDELPALPPTDDDSDEDMEEVIAPSQAPEPHDPDLREFRRGMALAALGRRNPSPKKRSSAMGKPQDQPLFAADEDETAPNDAVDSAESDEAEDDDELLYVLQESADAAEEAELQRAIEASTVSQPPHPRRIVSDPTRPRQLHPLDSNDADEGFFSSSSRLETALAIAGAGPVRKPPSRRSGGDADFDAFGTPSHLLTGQPTLAPLPPVTTASESDDDEDMEEILPEPAPAELPTETTVLNSDEDEAMEEIIPEPAPAVDGLTTSSNAVVNSTPPIVTSISQLVQSISTSTTNSGKQSTSAFQSRQSPPTTASDTAATESEGDMEEVLVPAPPTGDNVDDPTVKFAAPFPVQDSEELPEADEEIDFPPMTSSAKQSAPIHQTGLARASTTHAVPSASVPLVSPPAQDPSISRPVIIGEDTVYLEDIVDSKSAPPVSTKVAGADADLDGLYTMSDDEELARWSRSPSPVGSSTKPIRPRDKNEGWDAAHEMDPQAEAGDFAQFVAEVKGRDLDAVRKEIDEEIKYLNEQKKAAMRDSEDITQQMVSQIMAMLRLFGIPYITAPMEAEAQCAELAALGLVDGIITDDSDVFLFGGARVLKNMFNQSKTVECFLAQDLAREVGLDRSSLVRLAYLLGSDYVEGLSGVGPVVAMELMKEFPDEDGLHKFKEWWTKVQMGRDKEDGSKFKKRFKKKFKNTLYLDTDWPNPAVRDAYYHPTVDESEEPFKWGLPDLDALRGFLREELGWGQQKVDDLLLPIIHKVGKRGQTAALNQQGNLNDFFGVGSGGSGAVAPRKRQPYASKRLQQIVSDFRSAQKRAAGVDEDEERSRSRSRSASAQPSETGTEATEERPTKKKRATAKRKPVEKEGENSGVSGGDTVRKGKGRKRAKAAKDDDEFEPERESGAPAPEPPRRRPKPRPVKRTAQAVEHETNQEEAV